MQTDATQAQESTILGMINQVLSKKEFIEQKLESVQENETIIGVLSDEEKAIYIAAEITGTRHDKALNESSDDEFSSKEQRINCLTHDALYRLLWASIEARLKLPELESETLGIRKYWHIVIIPEELD
jgi:hypothetical protein